jgi:hypothetical protein
MISNQERPPLSDVMYEGLNPGAVKELGNIVVSSSISPREYSQENTVAIFEDYRQLCDQESASFRHLGILSTDGYERALKDEGTIYEVVDGKKVPAIVSIVHEDGYDAERCKQLTHKDEIMFLALPLMHVYAGALREGNDNGSEIISKSVAIVPESIGCYDDTHDSVIAALSAFGKLEAHEFLDERLMKRPGHESAWMALYGCTITPMTHTSVVDEAIPREGVIVSAEAKPFRAAKDFESAWLEYRSEKKLPISPDENSNEVYVFTPQQLRDNAGVKDGLWHITQQGFGDILGKYHPVSMEETKKSFESLLISDGTYTIVRFHEGKPACFGSISFDIDKYDWLNLNSKPMHEELESSRLKAEVPLLFSEIISSSEGKSYSSSVFHLVTDLCARTGQSVRLLFESTNLSSCYIPAMVKRLLTQSDSVKMTNPEQDIVEIARLKYWFATGK